MQGTRQLDDLDQHCESHLLEVKMLQENSFAPFIIPS